MCQFVDCCVLFLQWKGPAASGQMSSKAITDILHRLHEDPFNLLVTCSHLYSLECSLEMGVDVQ